MRFTAILCRAGALSAPIVLLFMSTAVLADSWYVNEKTDRSIGITYAPPDSAAGRRPYPSLDQALASIGPQGRVSTIDLGYVLNRDLLGMQDDIRSIMASTYPNEYATLLRSSSTPAAWRAWKGQPLRTKLHAAVLKSKIMAEIRPVLAQHCLRVADVSSEKQVVTLRSGTPYFTAFVWIELARCSN